MLEPEFEIKDHYGDSLAVAADLTRNEITFTICETYDCASAEIGVVELGVLVEHLAGLIGKRLV